MLASESSHGASAAASSSGRRMSFHNRLLLNRAVLSGLKSIEVLLLAARADDRWPASVSGRVSALGGRVLRTETAVGYARVEIAPEGLLALVATPDIQAYQISTFSRGTWYRDGPPLANAESYRGFEVTPIAATAPSSVDAGLPVLTSAEAGEPGFTAGDDSGVGEWMAKHPTFDGRGVTIALVENALASFADPIFRTAKTLDGRDVPKIAGILNAIDPADDDETRVQLNVPVEASRSWARVGNRTYILPHPGTYRMGMFDVPAGANVVHQFAVVEDQDTRQVWIDSNGDASFQDELPLADVNERFDPRVLKITYPRKVDASFVMGRGREPHVVHIYIGKGAHQTMTASVAAGNRSGDRLAYGVAPNARLLLVRVSSANAEGLARRLEGFIEAAQRPDVDVISASTPIHMVPDTAADFVGLFFTRLHAAYQKPIFNSAGNYGVLLGDVHANGEVLSVGSTLGPATFAALYGGRRLDRTIVHSMSAAGPSLDGAVKPDFLTPAERLSADLPWNNRFAAAPQNAPTRRLPPGYQASCCTSASSPYAAGVAALLISAARQSNVPYSLERLSRAMKFSARLLPGFQAHHQGHGVLDVNAAWREVTRSAEPPRIVASARVVHPLAQYAEKGSEGSGILEFGGWTAGMKGTRQITLTRESGPAEPITYRVAWSASGGTFSSYPSVTLPLGDAIPLSIDIDVASSGAHSALLTLHDSKTDAVVFRTQATIVAPERIDSVTRSVRVSGTLGLEEQRAHYFEIPRGTGALAFELQVTRGSVQPTILQAHGLVPSYYAHVHPLDTFFAGPGTYQVLMPNPEPGTWTVRVKTGSTSMPPGGEYGPRVDGDAEYTLTMRALGASILPEGRGRGTVAVNIINTGHLVAEPVLEASPGSLRSHRGEFLKNGLPNLFDIQVPDEATTLSLQLRSEQEGTNVELFLYDCTTGECFSYDIAFPADGSQRLLVRKPKPGRWVAAVNAAPFPAAAGSFVLDEVITKDVPVRRASAAPRQPGARWEEVIDDLPTPSAADGRTPVVFFELFDAAAERAEAERPWSIVRHYITPRDRPVAFGTAIYWR